MYLLGQLCGVITAVITVLQPQFRSKTQILLCAILNNSLSGLNYLLIGQTGSAVFLCLVAVVQSCAAIVHEKRNTAVSRAETLLFFCLYVGFGLLGLFTSKTFVWALTGQAILELLPIAGALMLMLSVFARGEQKTRVFLLLNAAVWAVYTGAIGSTVFFSSAASILSSLTALWKYRKAAARAEPHK